MGIQKSKYKSAQEWAAANPNAYAAAVKKGLLAKILKKFGWYINPSTKWTFETCKADALKYTSIKDWRKHSGAAYGTARKNNWADECTKHMKKLRREAWTLEECKKEAKKYKFRGEWQKKSMGSYTAARVSGWLEKCTAHMERLQKPNGYWTLERCKADALKYKTKAEWGKNSLGYKMAREYGFTEECCSHMVSPEKPKGYWTLERCMEDARKYQTRGDWRRAKLSETASGYNTAANKGWLDKCCRHMES